jgi:SAM-dependent methyltransferase
MDLKETDILGKDIHAHWYYSSKAKAVSRTLESEACTTILDVGAGSGFFSKYLLNTTSAQSAWCVDISYEADSDALESGKPVHYRRDIGAIDADLVMLMDVLEHVDDDEGLLQTYVDKVPEGSWFLITVPAFQFLWSGHDDFLEHKRRYTLKQLEAVVQKTGLTINKGFYFFGGVFPIVTTVRCLQNATRKSRPAKSQLARHSTVVNAFLKLLCRAELPFVGRNRIAGLSVFCLAQKPGSK